MENILSIICCTRNNPRTIICIWWCTKEFYFVLVRCVKKFRWFNISICMIKNVVICTYVFETTKCQFKSNLFSLVGANGNNVVFSYFVSLAEWRWRVLEHQTRNKLFSCGYNVDFVVHTTEGTTVWMCLTHFFFLLIVSHPRMRIYCWTFFQTSFLINLMC